MNNFGDEVMSTSDVAVIRELNDGLRTTLDGGTVLLTAGIAALGEVAQAAILMAVKQFDAFTPDNDPYGEHDFGKVDVAGETVMFKIDYLDRTKTWHSPDPANPDVTTRVLTIMLAHEW